MKFITILFVLAAASAAVAGVSGIVSDSSTGLPVQQAWVRYSNSDSAQTNSSGQYSLPGLAAGTYQVVARHSGYLNRRQQVILAVGDNTVNFSIRPLAAPMNPVGWWTFENALQPVQADVGNDLVLQGTHQVIQGPGGSGAVNIGVGSYYHCYHDIPANGGGTSWVNEFSLLIDFRVSQLGRWYSFFQTDISNTNDGDAFINTNGNIGVALTGYSSYAILPNEWYRLIISADLGSSYKYYLDGQLLRDGGAQLLNGRFSLYPSSNGNQVLLFADEDGEDNPIDVAQAAIFDYPLTAAQANELGGYGHIITDPAAVMTPYLQSPTPTSMYISWHFRYSSESFVDYGLTEALGQTASGTTQSISTTVLWHTTQLTSLQPNTTYYYRCRSDTAVTPIARFHTPPANGSRTGKLRFMLISDSQSNSSRSAAVAAAMRQTLISRFGEGFADSVQLVLHCGDVVGNGLDLASYQTEYFLPFRQINQSVPFMVSTGNHELESGNFYSYMKYEPFAGSQGEPYYSFQLGRVLFIALNSNVQGTTQSNWCNTRLQQAENDTTIDMVFVAMHHPGHSEVWPDGNTGWTLNTIFPILDACSKVVMVSFGHAHNFERGARPESHVRTVLCGGAGGTLDRWRMYTNQTDYPEIHRSFDYHHYILVEVDLANRIYDATAYSLGNDDHPQSNIPFDHWRHALGQNAPQTPVCLEPAGETVSPAILIGSAFAGSDTIQSSHFQLTSAPGNYAAPILNVLRDFENYYFDTGSPDFLPIDRNAGVQLTELGPIDSLLQVGITYGWRARYRDRNLEWSDWSAERTFVWLGPDTTLPETPQALTVVPYGDHMRLRWRSVPEPAILYHVYRDSLVAGQFTELVGTTMDTVFVDSGAVVSPQLKRFYLVKSARQ
jgi:hypothetical protein